MSGYVDARPCEKCGGKELEATNTGVANSVDAWDTWRCVACGHCQDFKRIRVNAPPRRMKLP